VAITRHSHSPGRPPPKKSGCAFTPRAASSASPAACRRQHELRPRVALCRKLRAACRDSPFCKLRKPTQKHGSIFSPHWPVDFCAPKRLVFGFAAYGAWICRLRHLSFACACACLALDLFVLVSCLLFVRLWRSYFQCTNGARFTSFGTSSEAKRKQHAAVYLISICCSAKGGKDQLLLLANSLVCCLFIYCRSTALSFGQAAIASCSRYIRGWSRRWCGHTQWR
jgi:hypothetical protein